MKASPHARRVTSVQQLGTGFISKAHSQALRAELKSSIVGDPFLVTLSNFQRLKQRRDFILNIVIV